MSAGGSERGLEVKDRQETLQQVTHVYPSKGRESSMKAPMGCALLYGLFSQV
jgi:hypothetical protein